MSLQQVLKACTYLGGVGFPFESGAKLDLLFSDDGVTAQGSHGLARFFYAELIAIEIDGPGSLTKGGGFVGGGFGVEGAVEGIAVAAVLNALTTMAGFLLDMETKFAPELKRLFALDADEFEIAMDVFKEWGWECIGTSNREVLLVECWIQRCAPHDDEYLYPVMTGE